MIEIYFLTNMATNVDFALIFQIKQV